MQNLEKFPETFFRKGETLFRQGDKAMALYILFEGSLAVVENEVQLATVSEPQSVVGELSHLLGTPRLATVRAETDCRMRVVTDVDAFFREDPTRSLAIARLLAQRVHAMDQRFLTVRRALDEATEEALSEEGDALPPALERIRGYLKAWRSYI